MYIDEIVLALSSLGCVRAHDLQKLLLAIAYSHHNIPILAVTEISL